MTTYQAEEMPEEHRRRGPGIGERFPDVRLPDQTGATIDLHKARSGRPALVVFYRSARW
jgi:peroxiredoxin